MVDHRRAGAAPWQGNPRARPRGLASGANGESARHGIFHHRAGLGLRGVVGIDRRLDLQGKRPIYAREGIGHLWLVDPTDRNLEAFELHAGTWVLIAIAKEGDPVSIPPFNAITFSLGDLWP